MILLVDIGNTRTKYLALSALELKDQTSNIHIVTNEKLSAQWFDQHWQKYSEIILANVSQRQFNKQIFEWANAHHIKLNVIESEQQKFGVTSFYRQPSQLGIDRWLALVATQKLYANKNILIIDAGTATTFDCLSAKGQHLGGWILPGIETMFSSLMANTAQISAKQQFKPSLDFGKDSSENINNACWAATIGTIEQAIKQSEKILSHLDHILLTGGNASAIKALLNHPCEQRDNLLFHGLSRYSQ